MSLESHNEYLMSPKLLNENVVMSPRAHPTLSPQNRDLTSLSESMREKGMHDRDTSNSFIETYFLKNLLFLRIIKKIHLKCSFADILLISFIFNFTFMCSTCIIVVDLIFVDLRFYSFRIEICNIYIT